MEGREAYNNNLLDDTHDNTLDVDDGQPYYLSNNYPILNDEDHIYYDDHDVDE